MQPFISVIIITKVGFLVSKSQKSQYTNHRNCIPKPLARAWALDEAKVYGSV